MCDRGHGRPRLAVSQAAASVHPQIGIYRAKSSALGGARA
eukprot:SAG31_NODE_25477_length_460_cov_1.548476_1_plen_39_part_10